MPATMTVGLSAPPRDATVGAEANGVADGDGLAGALAGAAEGVSFVGSTDGRALCVGLLGVVVEERGRETGGGDDFFGVGFGAVLPAAPTARAAFTRKIPSTLSAVFRSRDRICVFLYPRASSRAASPDMCGAAIEVPWTTAYLPSFHVE